MPDEHVAQEEAPGLGILSPRSRHLLELEFGSRAQFDDPSLEWRRLFSELNPVVSLAFALRGDFPWKRLPGYILISPGSGRRL